MFSLDLWRRPARERNIQLSLGRHDSYTLDWHVSFSSTYSLSSVSVIYCPSNTSFSLLFRCFVKSNVSPYSVPRRRPPVPVLPSTSCIPFRVLRLPRPFCLASSASQMSPNSPCCSPRQPSSPALPRQYLSLHYLVRLPYRGAAFHPSSYSWIYIPRPSSYFPYACRLSHVSPPHRSFFLLFCSCVLLTVFFFLSLFTFIWIVDSLVYFCSRCSPFDSR